MTHTGADSTRWTQAGDVLARALSDRWLPLVLRGLVAIAFGVLAFAWPALTLLTLTVMWGIYAIFDGVFALSAALFGRKGETASRWWLATVGVISLIAGGWAIAMPAAATTVLVILIGAWAFATGILQIWGAIRLRKEIEGEWLLMLSGVLSVAFGIAVIARPAIGALSIVWLIGAFALLIGGANVALGFRLRSLRKAH